MSPISDKARKILWGRSGNRCAICKHELVVWATDLDDESVIGEECHIISPKSNGPRHDPSFPKDELDAYENLILLCRTDHKKVDDQVATFPREILCQIKDNHEIWVTDNLTYQHKLKPIKFRRIKHNIPSYLVQITNGKEVLDLVLNAYAYSMDHDKLFSQDEVDVIGQFFQDASDWGDLGNTLEPSARVNAAFQLTKLIEELDNIGFFVFGGREVQHLEGGIQDEPSNWPVAILQVLRKNNQMINHKSDDDLQKISHLA